MMGQWQILAVSNWLKVSPLHSDQQIEAEVIICSLFIALIVISVSTLCLSLSSLHFKITMNHKCFPVLCRYMRPIKYYYYIHYRHRIVSRSMSRMSNPVQEPKLAGFFFYQVENYFYLGSQFSFYMTEITAGFQPSQGLARSGQVIPIKSDVIVEQGFLYLQYSK